MDGRVVSCFRPEYCCVDCSFANLLVNALLMGIYFGWGGGGSWIIWYMYVCFALVDMTEQFPKRLYQFILSMSSV